MNQFRLHLLALFSLTLLLSAGCGSWKTKEPIQLVECSAVNVAGGNRFLVLGGALRMSMPNEKILADLPAGTEIRIEHLFFAPSYEASLLGVTGSLTAGPHADQQAQFDGRFFTRDLIATIQQDHGDQSAVNTTWTVDPNMLEK
jgi:hypothetical protein